MTLTIRIRQDEELPAGQTAERRLEKGRLVIGRGIESDWVLADPGRTISKRHCVIEEAELGYELTDLSINGVFLNDEAGPVGVGNTRRLRHGDRIRIGPYCLAVELSEGDQPVSLNSTSLGLTRAFDSVTQLFGDRPDMFDLGSDQVAEKSRSKLGLTDLDHGPPLDAFFAPQPSPAAELDPAPGAKKNEPAAQTGAAIFDIPENWLTAPPVPPPQPRDHGRAMEQREPPRPIEEPNRTSASLAEDQQMQSSRGRAASVDPVAAFCAGADLDPELLADGVPEEILRKVGEIFRVTVEGLMNVLQSRRAQKGEFRLTHTEFRPAENNPLKFSVDAQAAMLMLIGKPRRGFLPAREAFDEAIDDIRMHEVAVLAGMQEAWLSLLQRFDPKELSQRLEDDGGLANLLGLKKARCWDAFTTLYNSIAPEWEQTFQNIFGRAYEQSMHKQRQRSG